MALHPMAARLLSQMSRLPSFDQMSVDEARQAFAIFEGLGGVGPAVADILDLSAPARDHDVPVRLYVPEGPPPYPTVLWCHGGGWVLGNLAVADAYCRYLCNKARCAVLSVEYRLGPHHRFPAPIEDCYAAAHFLTTNATSMGLDGARLAIAGESTGSNLALATALMARDRERIGFKCQVLFFPVVDPTLSSPSANELGTDYFFTTEAFRWFWSQYLADSSQRNHPMVDMLRHADLAGLPPTLVVTAEYDPVRDEGEQLARKLAEAGVRTELSRFDGMIHAFLGLEAMFEAASKAYEQAARMLNDTWGRMPGTY